MSTKGDPFAFELFKNSLSSIADEMALTVYRTSYSSVIKGSMDYSTAICDTHGRMVAQGLTLPMHLGSIPTALAACIRHYDNEIRSGDIYVLNDPFDGGMHLPDIFLFQPIFHNNQRIAFAATICHHTDVGGRVAGSNASDSTECYQEGLRIPPLKLYEEGRRNDTLWKIIEKNVRVPVLLQGDLRAQLSACHTGEVGLIDLFKAYGLTKSLDYMNEVIDYTERLTRAAIRELPDGVYNFEDWLDDDGIDINQPILLKVSFEKKGDQITADWTGSSPQVKGALNCTESFTNASVYIAVKSILSGDIPANEGFFRAIKVISPPGSICHGILPAATAARGLTGFRQVDCCFGALAKMVPDRVFAASDGGNICLSLGGYHADRKPFIYVDFFTGGWGGRPWADGPQGNANLCSNISSPSVEVTEVEQPLQILAYEFLTDGMGAGKFRGGAPFRRDYRMCEKEGTLQVRNDRCLFHPFGLYGGKPGHRARNVLNPETTNETLPGKVTRTIMRGDVIRYDMAGAGGWGDPLERATAQVLADVRNEYVSVEAARHEYGVILDTKSWIVDEKRTAELRQVIRSCRSWTTPPSSIAENYQPAFMHRMTNCLNNLIEQESKVGGFRVGVDIGGTFTDIVLLNDQGELFTKKVSSSVGDYSRAIVEGIAQVFEEHKLAPQDVEEVLHATTVASNTILEHKGARTGLITTKGFRDILELRRLRMPRLYDLKWEKPPALVDRYLRFEVNERLDEKGNVLIPLKDEDVEKAIDRLLAEDVEALAVCLLHSYVNPAHEIRIKEIATRRAPKLLVCISSEVLPEIKEYERTSTTVINAYVLPVVRQYCSRLRADLSRSGVKAPLHIMQSNGGLMTADAAAERPCNIIESGPAAGVVGAQALAQKIGLSKIISFDMGGTTAKASIIENGEVTRSPEYAVGAGIMIGSRLLTGAGYLLKVPAIDLAEVGAGGGSHIWIDPAGSLQVGPSSAGALPGPVCYELGGMEPTVTDANVILGYLNSTHLCGGEVRINAKKSWEAFEKKIAEPLSLSVENAAYGTHRIAASNMIRAIKAVSSERGRDVRDYALFAFGGNGPLFAPVLAEALQMKRIVVPPSPGVFSSFGLLYSEIEHHYSRTFWRVLRETDPALLSGELDHMKADALESLKRQGFPKSQAKVFYAASLRYKGQSFELSIPIKGDRVTKKTYADLEEAFGQEHERTYGHRADPDEPVEIVTLQVVGRGIPDKPRVPNAIRINRAEVKSTAKRRAYFGPDHGWKELSVLTRSDLKAKKKGPFIVEEYDATCVVPIGATASLDRFGNIVIDLKSPER